jgi:hypothetical protein
MAGMDWIDLSQDREQMRDLVDIVMGLVFHKCWEVLE